MSVSKRFGLAAGVALLVVVAASRTGFAQDPPPDPLKFSTGGPVTLIFQVKADKTADWEEAWGYILGLMAKNADPDLKAMGESMASKMYKVDQPPFDTAAGKATLYVFPLDSSSTKFSYNPQLIVYTYLKAGLDGGPTREEANPFYNKLIGAYINVSTWKLVKAGK